MRETMRDLLSPPTSDATRLKLDHQSFRNDAKKLYRGPLVYLPPPLFTGASHALDGPSRQCFLRRRVLSLPLSLTRRFVPTSPANTAISTAVLFSQHEKPRPRAHDLPWNQKETPAMPKKRKETGRRRKRKNNPTTLIIITRSFGGCLFSCFSLPRRYIGHDGDLSRGSSSIHASHLRFLLFLFPYPLSNTRRKSDLRHTPSEKRDSMYVQLLSLCRHGYTQ
ncbi:hypothetical protein Micbo1qcDRAFT_224421 [Microdochium bolleyi]|uniref:Uncharacterized protein n=1 Tax=Microdochium bolleyi TaxID=196109 RepID=A0A136J551_9PEZI|nr:hypothetical protein Micbo1qcDRAFT_224421 [Microdochium bolleyi]